MTEARPLEGTTPTAHEMVPQPRKTSERQRKLAEIALSRLKTEFVEPGNFDKRKSVLSKELINGVKKYLSHDSISIIDNWPPRPWQTKYDVIESLQTFRYGDKPELDELLNRDRVFSMIEDQLVLASPHLPSVDTHLTAWRAALVTCHRLRTDELEQYGESRLEPVTDDKSQLLVDGEWNAILTKIADARPAVLNPKSPDGV